MTEQRQLEIVTNLIKNFRFADLFILSRYLYRVGDDLIDDKTYNELENMLKGMSANEAEEYLNRTYDDDPIPYALLYEFDLEEVTMGIPEERAELASLFTEDKSLSISSVTSFEEAYEFYSYYRNIKKDLCHSIKVDGDNTKNLYTEADFKISLSRGRADGNSFDFTDNMAKCIPTKLQNVPAELRVFAEAYVESKYLPTLRQKYPKKDFVTEKSAALSMLRVEYPPTDYKHLKVLAFSAEGLSNSVIGTFERLKELGFSTPPYMLISWEDIPDNLEDFKEWLTTRVFNHFAPYRDEMPSDGIVVEVNDYDVTGQVVGQYSSRQLALKFGPWKFQHAKGIVTSIVMQQRRVHACMKVTIEPIKTSDGSRAKMINCFNPDILIKSGLEEGQEVYFERNSGAVNILIHGERLDGLKVTEVNDNDFNEDAEDTEDEEA